MNEVEKMYENAEVKKQIPKVCSSNELYCKECEAHIEDAMPYCKNAKYPPFTAEKQIELIKWLIQNDISDERIIRSNYKKTYYYCLFTWKYPFYESEAFTKFEEALAYIFNYLWQDLTEEEKQQVKGVLE